MVGSLAWKLVLLLWEDLYRILYNHLYLVLIPPSVIGYKGHRVGRAKIFYSKIFDVKNKSSLENQNKMVTLSKGPEDFSTKGFSP